MQPSRSLRSLRSVVVVDAGEPRNAPAAGAHNVLARDGISPLELLAAGQHQVEQYRAEIRHDRAVAARCRDGGFEVDLAGGKTVRAPAASSSSSSEHSRASAREV